MVEEINIDELKTQYESQLATLTKERDDLIEQVQKNKAEIGKLQAYVAKYACSRDSEPVKTPVDETITFQQAYENALNEMKTKE